jgi:methionyl-tRNA synthetase
MVNKINKTSRKKRLVTAALPYINNVPHLGHIVGSHLPADIFARYCRAKGYETLFVGGADENGSASEIAAKSVGQSIDKFATKLNEEHRRIYDWFGISYDNFSRTSRSIHVATVVEFFKKLDENGYIHSQEIDAFYSPEDDMFLPDRYIEGECPKCGYKEANGDQCEQCTTVLNPSDLKNPHSKISGGNLEMRKTKHLYLELDKLSPKLEEWINKQDLWRPQVKNLAMSWIREGLRARGITRDLKNGVPVPKEGFKDKVFYVWFDAPIGYVSSTKEASKDWESYWKGDDSEIFNFLGKDNIPFHTIFWPAMVIGEGEYNLPKNVLGLQYLNYEGQKFSKSKGVGVFCETLPELAIDVDMWRSYLTQVIPESNDSEFSWQEFQERVNSDLLGNFGNYVNRIVKFANTKLAGEIDRPDHERLTEGDLETLKQIEEYKDRITRSLESGETRKAWSEVFKLCSIGNKYLHDNQPWNVIKENPTRVNDIYYVGTRLLKAASTFAAPFIPSTAEKIWKQLGLEGSPLNSGEWNRATEDLDEKHKFGKDQILFKKLDEKTIEESREKASHASDLKSFFNQNLL